MHHQRSEREMLRPARWCATTSIAHSTHAADAVSQQQSESFVAAYGGASVVRQTRMRYSAASAREQRSWRVRSSGRRFALGGASAASDASRLARAPSWTECGETAARSAGKR